MSDQALSELEVSELEVSDDHDESDDELSPLDPLSLEPPSLLSLTIISRSVGSAPGHHRRTSGTTEATTRAGVANFPGARVARLASSAP